MIDKLALHQKILVALEDTCQVAVNAEKRAYDTATDKESKAENKYDTFGLEASYLAHGQSQRVSECERDLRIFKQLKPQTFSIDDGIAVGALIQLEDDAGVKQMIFISPVAGGLKIRFNQQEITLITPAAPLGRALIKSYAGDDISIALSIDQKHYQILTVD